MKSSRFFSIFVAAALIASAVFAFDRYFSFEAACRQNEERMASLDDARHLIQAHPEIFGANAATQSTMELKALVQQSGARHGIVLLYLSESDRDAGEKVKERNVVARAVNVSHAKLVAFLADLEAQGGGARIKELRLKPAPDRNDMYQEAESILAIRWINDADAKRTMKEGPR